MKEVALIMDKYGRSVVKAVELIRLHNLSPREAWEKATLEVFGGECTGQKKGCPRNAFLGLCEAGLIEGVEKSKYTNSQKNKEYALKAVDLLRRGEEGIESPNMLWKRVIGVDNKSHNSQMNVVIALWEHKLINN